MISAPQRRYRKPAVRPRHRVRKPESPRTSGVCRDRRQWDRAARWVRASCSTARPSASPPGTESGLVGRNGAGKTTLTKVLAGQGQPAAGSVTATGEVGYLPQDPRTGDLHVLARDRILSARGLDRIITQMREAEGRDGQRRRRDP